MMSIETMKSQEAKVQHCILLEHNSTQQSWGDLGDIVAAYSLTAKVILAA